MKQIRTKGLALVLALCVLVGAWPAVMPTVKAAGTVSLDLTDGSIVIAQDEEGNTVYTQGETVTTGGNVCVVRQSDSATATANTITVESGEVQVTLAGVNIAGSISVKSGAALSLILVGENEVSGVRVLISAKLTIVGSGTLTTNRIGNSTSYGVSAGDIVINGGTVVAAGLKEINGIEGNTVTINGGTVNATGGEWKSGIYGMDTVVINGGTVTATGGKYGSGIGGSNITITGGTVTATSGERGAGICGTGGNITITGGTVTAHGVNSSYAEGGAGIGGRYQCNGGTITISGGVVTATSGNAAGIGGGAYYKNAYYNSGCTVSIANAKVTAVGGCHAIGGGELGNLYGCDSITIGENVELDLTHIYSSGAAYQERIFDLELKDEAALSGNATVLTTVARGASGIVSYQWQTSPDGSTWTDAEGITTAACTIPMTAENDEYYFRCKVTNGFGNVAYTDAAQGHVLAFDRQPESVEVGAGDLASLAITASCSNVTYQWERSYDNGVTWSDVSGEIYATLIVSTTLSENGALYRCVITAANGDQLASDAAEITVQSDAVTYTIRDYLQNADGSTYTVANQTVVEAAVGDVVTAPDATFEGYTRNTTKGVVSGTVTEDCGLVLERYFDRNTYAITFDMQGGSALPDVEALWGADVTRPTDPSRYGFTFGGWYADNACTQEFEFTVMPVGGATVYAKWISGDEGRSGVEYTINGILLRDGSTYEPVSGIPTGNLLAEISVTNLCSVHMDTVMLVTYDKDGRMLEMGFLYAGVPVGETFTFGMAVDNTDGKVGEVKAFVLSSLNSILPLAEAKSYDGT